MPGTVNAAALSYSLVVPYFRTPEITRLCLYSIFKFARGTPEVIVVDNGSDAGMLREFPAVRVIDNPGAPLGSAGNFRALDVGVAAASHDLLGLLHSDTVFFKEGWDLECFGRLERGALAALGTFEREANPFRALPRRLHDGWLHLRHEPRAAAGGRDKLMLHFLLTRKSTLARAGVNFGAAYRDDGHFLVAHFDPTGRPVEVLSGREVSRILWHTSNITSLLTGQMDDPKSMARYQEKRRQLLADGRFREAFGPVLPRD